MLKGLPLTYDRDMQEDKEPAFDAVDTLQLVLPALAGHDLHDDGTGRTGWPPPRRWATRWPPRWPSGWSAAACRSGRRTRSPATWCGTACGAGKELTDLDDAELAAVDPQLTPEVRAVLDVPGALRARSAPGGTAPARVADQLAALTGPCTGTGPGRRRGSCRWGSGR